MASATAPGSAPWRAQRLRDLRAFARSSRVEGGFAWLSDSGRPETDRPLQLWINARMTYVFADEPELAGHGIEALARTFRDPEHDGWFAAVRPDGEPVDTDKQCYGHAFVVLATCTAARQGIEGAPELADAALGVHLERFWDGRFVADVRSRDWSETEPYRGANAAMHTVEAWLAAATTTGDPVWLQRAATLAGEVISRTQDWRVVEHFDEELTPLPAYNLDEPRHPFRPYGATPGHAFEWARLLLELDSAIGGADLWMRESAVHLFDRAVADAVTDRPGLPYTTDWDGRPVVEERFHWVMAEAVMAATALEAAGHPTAGRLRERWWREIDEHFVDGDRSWHHELDTELRPSRLTWGGRPDAYHAFNALRYEPIRP